MDFIRQNFDKLLLASLLLVMLGVIVHMTHDHADAGNVSWAREQSGTVLGALITLVTGAILANKKQDPPAPPVA